MFKAKYFLSGVVASALLIASAALPASDAPAERSTSVRFADLNLDRQADVATLYQRLSAAADQLCSSRVGLYDTRLRYQNCVAETVHRAVGSVNRTALTEYYRQQQAPDIAIKVARQ